MIINESSYDDDLIKIARETIDPIANKLKPGIGLLNPKYNVTFLGDVIASYPSTKLTTKTSSDVGDISSYIARNTKSVEEYYLVSTNFSPSGAVIKMAPYRNGLPELEIRCTYNKPSIINFIMKKKNLRR